MMQQELNRHNRDQTSIAPLTYGPQPPPALNTLPALSQQYLLIRDLLQVLSGVEGQYIRVAASGAKAGDLPAAAPEQGRRSALRTSHQSNAAASAQQAGATLSAGLQKASDATFLIDLDSADRSCANQVINFIFAG